MWWLTVGWDRPDGSMRSQAHTSSASAEAMKLTAVAGGSGSDSAANDRASVSAVGLVEHLGADRGAAGDRVEHGGGAAAMLQLYRQIFELIH